MKKQAFFAFALALALSLHVAAAQTSDPLQQAADFFGKLTDRLVRLAVLIATPMLILAGILWLIGQHEAAIRLAKGVGIGLLVVFSAKFLVAIVTS